MSHLRCLLLYIGLVTLSWNPSYCQDLRALKLKIVEEQIFEDTLDDYPSLQEEIQDSMDVINDLWTIHLPRLLKEYSSFEEGISEACINSTLSILYETLKPNITMPEIVPLLDATGKLEAGLLSGNQYLRGSFDECFKYNYTGYCVAHIGQGPTPWTIGLCVPKYCNAEDVKKVMNYTGKIKINEVSGGVKCENSKFPEYSSGAIAMLWVCGVLLALER